MLERITYTLPQFTQMIIDVIKDETGIITKPKVIPYDGGPWDLAIMLDEDEGFLSEKDLDVLSEYGYHLDEWFVNRENIKVQIQSDSLEYHDDDYYFQQPVIMSYKSVPFVDE